MLPKPQEKGRRPREPGGRPDRLRGPSWPQRTPAGGAAPGLGGGQPPTRLPLLTPAPAWPAGEPRFGEGQGRPGDPGSEGCTGHWARRVGKERGRGFSGPGEAGSRGSCPLLQPFHPPPLPAGADVAVPGRAPSVCPCPFNPCFIIEILIPSARKLGLREVTHLAQGHTVSGWHFQDLKMLSLRTLRFVSLCASGRSCPSGAYTRVGER